MKLYKCPECGWVGSINSMEMDSYALEDGDESFCSTICPECWSWQELDDYEVVEVIE